MPKTKSVRINLILEVESIEALRSILYAGSQYSLYDYKIINFNIEKKAKHDK